MTLAAVLELFSTLAKLGISPPVQDALSAFIAKEMGVAQPVLDAALAAATYAPPPKA